MHVNVLFLTLIYFKYAEFILSNIFSITGINIVSISSPFIFIAISYVIIQLIGYFIDVYYKRIVIEKNFLNFSFFILFFPKIISGPIERGAGLLPQLRIISGINYKLFIDGLKIFIYGYFFKVVIADRLSIAVNNVYNAPNNFNSLQILTSIFFFSFQIYTDFLSYSYMAVGTSKMLGFNITNNFHLPFLSQSISEFWKRWHISLSFWLRDYLFLPISYWFIRKLNNFKFHLGKSENYSYIFATFITMTLCGLWHGPKWTFVAWGIIHSVLLVISFITRKQRKHILRFFDIKSNSLFLKYLRMLFIFTIVTFTFVFFRANSIDEAVIIFEGILSFRSHSITTLFFNLNDLFISIFMVFAILITEIIQYKFDNNKYSFQIYELINTPMLLIILIFIFLLGKFGESDFIYFKF